jgi:AcrR family transcriptional regulator
MKDIDNPKFQQIVTTAKELFWKFGIKRVTIEEICQEANVSKMTFYKHFKNKKELIKYFINHLLDKGMQKYRAIMDSNIPFKEKVIKTLDLKMEQTMDMSNEFFNDYVRHADSEMIALLQQKRNEMMSSILNDYIEAQKMGDIRKDIKPEFILYFLNQIVEMIKDEQLEKMYDHPQDMIMEFTNFFFYGVLPRDGKKAK